LFYKIKSLQPTLRAKLTLQPTLRAKSTLQPLQKGTFVFHIIIIDYISKTITKITITFGANIVSPFGCYHGPPVLKETAQSNSVD
jgi:hypothetical protein